MKLGGDIKQAIESLALDKGVTVDSMYEALVSAFRSAYMRIEGAAEEARVTLDRDSGEVTVYAQELDNEGNVLKEWEADISDNDFGRIAAQSFKQMMTTKVRDAKRATVLEAYIGREGELITGIVTQFDSRFNQTIIDLQDAEAVIPSSERIPFERLERGNRIKALITEVREDAKGIPIIISRNRPEFIQKMLELEVPELNDGTIERDQERVDNEAEFGCFMTNAQIERGDCFIIIEEVEVFEDDIIEEDLPEEENGTELENDDEE